MVIANRILIIAVVATFSWSAAYADDRRGAPQQTGVYYAFGQVTDVQPIMRTVRVTTCSMTSPPRSSPNIGPSGFRARVGFIPTSPQHAAGTRMEPPPSFACAIGTTPAATAAAEPPLEPPVE